MQLFLSLTVALLSFHAFAVMDQDEILHRKAMLVAKKVHQKNLHLIGIDPKTCKPTEDSHQLLDQIGMLKNGTLSHCPEYVKEKIRPVEEAIRQIESGVFVREKMSDAIIPLANENERQLPEQNEVSEIQSFAPQETVSDISRITDHTGLTGEQKSQILEAYEQNREEYESDDADDIFDIVSKAYVRNLKRIISPSP